MSVQSVYIQMILLDSSCRAALSGFNARQTCLGALMCVGALFCGEAQANIWDRLVWNDLEMEIQIIPQPLDDFYAKTPFFDNAVALLSPSVVPIRTLYVQTPYKLRQSAKWPYLRRSAYGSQIISTGYEPQTITPHEAPAPVPLPASGWLMLAGLALLRGMRNGRA